MKNREYTEEALFDELLTIEEYEVSIDEIVEGIPEAIKDDVSKYWKKEFDEWGEKLIVSKAKDARIFQLELHCKNGAVIPSEHMQDDVTPHSLSKAFGECLQRLEYCIQFYYAQVNYIGKQIEEELDKKIIPFKPFKKEK